MDTKTAPAFNGIVDWINTPSITRESLKGQVVLLNFWTYTCHRSQRTLPYMQQLWNQYWDHGLTVIGVHTPEFSFECEQSNVEQIVAEHDITHPVALDVENTTWNLYGNQYRPRQTVIDQDSRIQHEHIGNDGHARIEEEIRRLLRRDGQELPDPVFTTDAERPEQEGTPEDSQPADDAFTSPDVYLGEQYDCVPGNTSHQVCFPYTWIDYEDKHPDRHELNRIYLHGEWMQDAEHIMFHDTDGYAALRFAARECGAVLDVEDGGKLYVELDGEPVPVEKRGPDLEEHGNSTAVTVEQPGLYRLISQDDVAVGEIKIVPATENTRLYVFRFA